MAALPTGFVRSGLVPALWLFAIPALGLGFSWFATAKLDGEIVGQIVQSVDAPDRAATQAFLDAAPPSLICTSGAPELKPQADVLAPVCGDYRQLHWIGRGSLIAMALGVLTALVTGALSWLAWRRPDYQILAFRLGSGWMRGVSAVQAVLQGVIVVALSYWVPVILAHVYEVRVIAIAGVMAVVAVVALIRAIFKKPDLTLRLHARPVPERAAPAFWARVRQLANAIGTAPPDQILAGIDDNFFVTNGVVEADGQRYTGRTMFVSLSLLRVLSRREADAVVAHELAHFSGGDTAQTQILVPMLARYEVYLAALRSGVVTIPVFYSMLPFYTLFQLSRARSSREREVRADRIAAEQTSARDAGAALIKVGAWASFRHRVEASLFGENTQLDDVAIAHRVQSGFAEYAGSTGLNDDLVASVTPHPFDSHPVLDQRLDALGNPLSRAQFRDVALSETSSGWLAENEAAVAIEHALWTEYEARFTRAHELSRAHRALPSTDEERALVLKHFPPCTFATRGTAVVRLTYIGIEDNDVGSVPFDIITNLSVKKGNFTNNLVITTREGDRTLVRKLKLNKLAKGEEQRLLGALGAYWGRHTYSRKVS